MLLCTPLYAKCNTLNIRDFSDLKYLVMFKVILNKVVSNPIHFCLWKTF